MSSVTRSVATGARGKRHNRSGLFTRIIFAVNILIRSLWLQGDTLQLRAGAGIVFDSEPMHELQETRAKARGLLRALGAAE